ncbi:8-oxo-dGTP diphosphatase [Bradyrhizobium sp. USDA 4341]
MRHIVKVGLAVVRDARILMVRKRNGLSFILPGGKLEAGESELEALIRELDEELGCRLVSAEYLGDFSAPAADLADTTVTVRLYRGEISGDPAPRSEIAELRWIAIASPEVAVAPSLAGKILPFLLEA